MIPKVLSPARRALLALVPIAALVVLAGCASGTAPAATPTPEASIAPVSLENCGFAVTVDAPPTRIVTIKSTSVEMVAALGLADRIVGAAFLDGPIPESLLDGVTPPVMEGKLPSQEAVLALRPDLVFGGWESNFSAEGAGDRAELAGLGIASYVSPAACRSAGVPGPLTFEGVFNEITEAGALLGAKDAAAKVVAAQRKQLATVEPDTTGLTAAWYSSGRETPYMGAGTGAPQIVMDALGLKNIFGDVAETWVSVGWERVIEANPDVIVLVDSPGNHATDKIERLKADPVLSKLKAVQGDAFLVIPFAASEAGVRTVPALVDLAAQLRALGLEGHEGQGE